MNRVAVSAEGVPLPPWSERLERYALKVMQALGLDQWDLSVLLCDEQTIRDLNRRFRGKDESTDVLSFELGEYTGQGEDTRFLPGDIAISLKNLSENAVYFNVPEDEELRRLVVHGILHLNGDDHATNDPEQPMLRTQEKILSELSGERILS
ncbi:rRNA maturation RNase YbeY [Breznakiella homolactica]|uniref:Endoribonuclease YbeY n=1 Tax=Breznakiella homolactica TaxID=2798577 RepID=A0A7T7XL34_9SPIR|nr:rRNA maturation RNase YbeY [Breznakiella homolactica]QQO08291.1 rRNA maturation RNase YbeY [Breznakiella homolactica]